MADTNFQLSVGAKVVDNIQQQLDKMTKKTVTVTPILNSSGVKEMEKTVKTYTDGLGKTIQTTQKFNVATGQTSTYVSKVSDKLQTASKHTKTLGEDFLSTAGKVAKFGAITSIIGAFTSSIAEAVKAVSELDNSLTELKKVSDISASGLKEYTQDAFNMARELSTTASNVTDAVALFVQAGYSMEEAQGLSKYSIMLQSIADKSMDAETATNFLTSTIKAFNMNASDAEKIINSVNEISNKYSVTSNDLTENLSKVSGVAGIAGVSFEELLGLMTASVEKTRNASKSANAFKSIFINLQQMNKDGTLPKLSEGFSEFGISMTDSNGAIKDAYDLLQELSVAYKEVSASTDVDKQNKMRTLLEDIGG